MNLPAKKPTAGEIMESVIVKGDLSKLDPGERANYYAKVCESIGLNPLTRPLEYITLSGKLTLYAKRDCADQLRRLNGISIEIVSQQLLGEMFTVHVRAQDRAGRTDEDFGVVTLTQHMKGDARANTILKAITKAKRRVTLSISGLGFLDETEVEDIPAAAKRVANIKPTPALAVLEEVDPNTGEVVQKPPLAEEMDDEIPFGKESAGDAADAPAPAPPSSPVPGAGALADEQLTTMAQEAAQRGRDVFDAFYKARTKPEQAKLRAMKSKLEAMMGTPDA